MRRVNIFRAMRDGNDTFRGYIMGSRTGTFYTERWGRETLFPGQSLKRTP